MDKKRCKNGERKDPKTGECVKMSEELKKHKRTLRNKGARLDETENRKKTVKRREPKEAAVPIVSDILNVFGLPTPSIIQPEKKPRCPTGQRKDAKTGMCSRPGILSEKELILTPVIKEPEPVFNPISQELNTLREISAIEEEKEEEEQEEQEPTFQLVPIQNKNEYLLKNEKSEYDDPITENILYPTLDDPNFSSKIASRQEFHDTTYDGEINDIQKQSDLLCSAQFELLPHQLFVRNFLSFQTPYNSLLLYHGLGSGKTCSAIGIAEEMRMYMKQMGITKRIIIVASPNVQDNFKLQLFDERRLKQLPDGTWNLNTCIGNALLQEINPTNLQGLTRERIISQIKSIIQNYYVFMGNKGEFANYIKKATNVPEDSGFSKEEMEEIRKKKIKAHFNNRLVILDEIHNVRISDANKTKMTAVLLNEIAKKSDNMRLLLMSATPMYNSHTEIIWLVNLLNANDKRGLIKEEDVFQSDGSFVEEQRDKKGNLVKESGKSLLSRKLTGYISYVRGENPYIFPYRVYPDTHSPENALIHNQYPSVQMNQQPITDPLKYIPIYKNSIGEYQSKGYQFIINYLGLKSTTMVDKNGKERIMPNFANMESFGYTLLLPPLESLIMVYPNPALDKILDTGVFEQEETREVIQSILGKKGLMNIMKFSQVENPIPKRFDYEYKSNIKKAYGEIFTQENIHKYSSKIANICGIIRRPSHGIILIYSQYIDGGLIPMALALESMGFSRYASSSEHNRNLLKTPYESVDAITMKPRSQMAKTETFHPAKYVIITGEKDFSQKNDEDVKYITSKTNADGSMVKVVLISMAASEGVDFKNIRQVHILEPWYNMNRIEQIIGRGVRNYSHCDLEFENRNVEIYLHGTILDKDEESADLYVYRSAEKKAVQIGQVTRLLKETAVDCLLNIGQTNFTETKLLENVANQDIHIRLSSSGKKVPFKIGDKPRTEICDYMEDCVFKCAVRETYPINKATYDEPFVKNNSVMIMNKIRDLFLERSVYKREHLIDALNLVKKYPIQHIYYALTRFINSKNETITDKYGRIGYLISRGEYYAFQPNEIMDESLSVFERSVPVDYKPTSLLLELPKEIQAGLNEIRAPRTEENVADEPVKEAQEQRSYREIMTDIIKTIQIIERENPEKIKASDNNWYKHENMVNKLLMDSPYSLSSDDIVKYVIYHYLDVLPLNDKLTLVSYVYGTKEPLVGHWKTVKEYYDRLRLEYEDETAIVLADGEANKMFVKEEGVWRPSQYTDEKTFGPIRKERLTVPIGEINPTEIGFMHPFKQKEVVFKTKDMRQKRNNKGAKCTDSSKPLVAQKLATVLNHNSIIYSETSLERPQLCVLLEMLMRWLTDTQRTVYFLGPEKTNEMDITNLKL
jgi:hypothetical protein